MTSKSPPRHGNQRGPMSKKTERLFGYYERELRLRYAARTVGNYLHDVGAFVDWLSERGLELRDVRAQDVESYQNALVSLRKKDGKAYSIGNQHNRLSAIKSLFRFLYQRGYVLQNPTTKLDYHLKETRLPRAVLTEREVRRLLDEAQKDSSPRGLRDRAVLELLYATGLRATELANLTPWDVNLEERTLRIDQGKGRKDRNVPLTTAACEAIEAYLELGRPALVRKKSVPYLLLANEGGWLHRAVLSRLIARYAVRARIGRKVTAHTFRHSVATHLLKGRADIRHIQKLLGHSSLHTTERYTRVEISDLRKVIARAHPRG
jgi:integrase/recombinase XerD